MFFGWPGLSAFHSFSLFPWQHFCLISILPGLWAILLVALSLAFCKPHHVLFVYKYHRKRKKKKSYQICLVTKQKFVIDNHTKKKITNNQSHKERDRDLLSSAIVCLYPCKTKLTLAPFSGLILIEG